MVHYTLLHKCVSLQVAINCSMIFEAVKELSEDWHNCRYFCCTPATLSARPPAGLPLKLHVHQTLPHSARKCAEISEFFCMPLICVSTCNRTVQSNCIDWVTECTQITQNDVYKVNLCILIGGGWTLFGIEVVHDLEWDQPTHGYAKHFY